MTERAALVLRDKEFLLNEIERLTAQAQTMAQSITELTLDNARLRALLREGIEVTMPYGDDGTVAYWRAKARRALENKP